MSRASWAIAWACVCRTHDDAGGGFRTSSRKHAGTSSTQARSGSFISDRTSADFAKCSGWLSSPSGNPATYASRCGNEVAIWSAADTTLSPIDRGRGRLSSDRNARRPLLWPAGMYVDGPDGSVGRRPRRCDAEVIVATTLSRGIEAEPPRTPGGGVARRLQLRVCMTCCASVLRFLTCAAVLAG